ncbi:MAG: alpha-L-fucosidase [Phycisphaerales bacterium]|nr:MAG: alpha-L-fucosidase [Phycisphaerales bacterium]
MYVYVSLILVLALVCSSALCDSPEAWPGQVRPPEPYGAVPSPAQLKWHELEFYGFLHFTTNTFTDKEWGYGDEDPAIFNPTAFDADQIVRTAHEAGMRGLILTCKHHDGFCLWDSAHTTHDVASSPWKNGKGDVVREISDSCRRHGLTFGVYLSPWDRNHPEYGRPTYIEYFRKQLRELLSNYGPIAELWFDGANGGDGYYGGARESRIIDRSTYYDWETTIALARSLQPDVCIFSDAGPEIRWVGNEAGHAGDPCWATYTARPAEGETVVGPGTTRYREGYHGHRDGEKWMPAEVDVSIRPGWFHHASQDEQVRSPENLVDMYFASVGRGASLLLNIPPDRRGIIHEADVDALRGFRRIIDATFNVDLARGARAVADNVRGNSDRFAASNVLDDDRSNYWCTDDGVTAPELVLELPTTSCFNVVSLREYLPLGQRVTSWALDAWIDGVWTEFASGQAIGNRRLWRGPYITTDKVRMRITDAPVCPAISEFALHAEPAKVEIRPYARAFIDRTDVGLVTDKPGCEIHYTTNGSEPTVHSPVYSGPFQVTESCTIRAVAIEKGEASPRAAKMDLVAYSRETLLHPIVFIRKPDPGIDYACYGGGWQTLDQMKDRQPITTGVCDSFDISVRSRDEHVALAFTGVISVPADGIYRFFTASDDGSRLFIHDQLVVDNDGLHGMTEREGLIGLKAGYHPICVEWFNATGGAGLNVEWAGPGIDRQPIPGDVLAR